MLNTWNRKAYKSYLLSICSPMFTLFLKSKWVCYEMKTELNWTEQTVVVIGSTKNNIIFLHIYIRAVIEITYSDTPH